METQVCTGCKVEKPLSDFQFERGRLKVRCRACVQQYQHEWYLQHRARRLAATHANWEAHKEEINADRRKHYAARQAELGCTPIYSIPENGYSRICTCCDTEKPLDQFSAKQNGYRMSWCKVCRAAATRDYVSRNPEKSKAAVNHWRAGNKPRILAQNKAWIQNNPERYRRNHINAQHRRSARKRGAVVSPTDMIAIYERDNYTCYLCGHVLDPTAPRFHPDEVTLDHVIPLARGGAHSPNNLRVCCRPCNLRKSDRMPVE